MRDCTLCPTCGCFSWWWGDFLAHFSLSWCFWSSLMSVLQDPQGALGFFGCLWSVCAGRGFSLIQDFVLWWNSVYPQWKCFCFQRQAAHCGHMEVWLSKTNHYFWMLGEPASFWIFLAAETRAFDMEGLRFGDLEGGDFNFRCCHLFLGDGRALGY